MKSIIFEEIKRVLRCEFVLENPKNKNLAHFSTPLAFSLAKGLKKSPALIASDLALKFEDNPCFESVEAVGGYLNFRLSKALLNTLCDEALKNPQNFAKGEEKKQKFLLEYVSANPTGPLHIGHARGAIFGDTLVRVARHLGYGFDTEYYVNDAGNQIDFLGLSVLNKARILCLGEELEYPQECYKGDYIDDLAREAFSHFGADFFSDENLNTLADWAKDKMMERIQKDLRQARIKIDNYSSEKSYYNALNLTLEALKERGGTYEKEGKIWLASSQKGDKEDRVIVREDGRGTYLAADIVYHRDKMSRGYDGCVNIWGADHHGYIARMRAAVEFLGFDSKNLEIILAQMVSLLRDGQPYKMSKRAGNFILMSEVLDEIGPDALRFIFLSKKCDTHLEFDINDLKKQDSSNPIFYINYAYARIQQIFAKTQKSTGDILGADFSSLNEEGANLLFEALNLKAVLSDAFEARALQKIPDYLKNLAAAFHKFYYDNRVIGAANEDSLLKLFAMVGLSLKTACGLLGLELKDKMQSH